MLISIVECCRCVEGFHTVLSKTFLESDTCPFRLAFMSNLWGSFHARLGRNALRGSSPFKLGLECNLTI